MLSPLDLKNKKIETKKRKYDKVQMDEYLELVFENYKGLFEENESLKKEVKSLNESIKYYRSIESTMQKALVLAEKTSKETKDAAILKAEAIEKDANIKADKIIAEAENEYDMIREKCLRLMEQFNNYKKQLKQVTTAQLELITSGSFEVEGPIIKNELNHPIKFSHTEEMEEVQPVAEEAVEEGFEDDVEPAEASDIIDAETEIAEEASEDTEIVSGSDEEVEEENNDIEAIAEETTEEDTVAEENVAGENDSEEIVEDTTEEEEAVHEEPTEESAEESAVAEENLDKTMIIPDLKDSLKGQETPSDNETIDILTADTIDLSDSINHVKKVTEPIPEGFEYAETKVAEKKAPEQLEPKKEKSDVPTLDSLLQSMNMSKKKKGKKGQDEDPFEFLGSVDDF